MSHKIVKANAVINEKVKSNDNENLGKIEEIMIEKSSGEVQYVVLSFGGILGMGEKLFALPWNSIHYSPEEKCFILNVAKKTLENNPTGFDKNNWPDMADPLWIQSIKSWYGDFDQVKDKAKDAMSDLACNVKESLQKGGEEIKKSGEDWINYIQAHPAQSILFGIVSYFAIKGMMKD
jgi:sporulation protein YlmC with PRC-barrel domain